MERILLEKTSDKKEAEKSLILQLGGAIINRMNYNRRWGVYYLAGEDLIAKKITDKEEGQRAWREYSMGNYLFERGIQVPKMHGVISPESLCKSCDVSRIGLVRMDDWFLVMQKINGKELEFVSGADRDEAIKQLKEEIAKVLKLGICPYDSLNDKNSIFDEKERKLYLIDFEQWIEGWGEELKHFGVLSEKKL